MTIRTFLLIDSVALDAAGIAALIAGETALGITLLVLAALTLVAFLGRSRRVRAAA